MGISLSFSDIMTAIRGFCKFFMTQQSANIKSPILKIGLLFIPIFQFQLNPHPSVHIQH